MKEFLNTVKDSINERIKNPFIGAFIISWIVVNWKPIAFFLLSDLEIKQRIYEISKNYSSYISNLLIPLGIALFYSVGFPYIMFVLDTLSRKGGKLRKNIHTSNKGDDLDNKITIAQKEFRLEEIRSGQRDKQEMNEKIELLEQSNSISAVKIQDLLTELNTKTHEIAERGSTIRKINDLITDLSYVDEKMISISKESDYYLDYRIQYIEFKKSKLNDVFFRTDKRINLDSFIIDQPFKIRGDDARRQFELLADQDLITEKEKYTFKGLVFLKNNLIDEIKRHAQYHFSDSKTDS